MFLAWQSRFNDYIDQNPNRRALLLVDNLSVHGSEHTLPELSCVTVRFLPPITTSKIQPLYAGIIAAIKLRYNSFHMERDLDMADVGVQKMYDIDTFNAMRGVPDIWR